jgi:hypothetical protein
VNPNRIEPPSKEAFRVPFLIMVLSLLLFNLFRHQPDLSGFLAFLITGITFVVVLTLRSGSPLRAPSPAELKVCAVMLGGFALGAASMATFLPIGIALLAASALFFTSSSVIGRNRINRSLFIRAFVLGCATGCLGMLAVLYT